jgi:hypothetical protein
VNKLHLKRPSPGGTIILEGIASGKTSPLFLVQYNRLVGKMMRTAESIDHRVRQALITCVLSTVTLIQMGLRMRHSNSTT